MECTILNQTTDKLITLRFEIIDSVKIDHLPNVCSVLIVIDKEDKSIVRLIRKVLQMQSVIIMIGRTYPRGGNI